MNILIDSSVWIEFFSGGPKAKAVERYLKPPHKIVLPSIVSYEVYKKIKSFKGEQVAVLLLAQMERLSAVAISFDQPLAVQAADISLQHKIPMADAMIYSSALVSDATVVTMDVHFKGLPRVELMV
jgi:predicted nucleic acid-binding protein